jgi:hypothetical protein
MWMKSMFAGDTDRWNTAGLDTPVIAALLDTLDCSIDIRRFGNAVKANDQVAHAHCCEAAGGRNSVDFVRAPHKFHSDAALLTGRAA